MKLILKTTKPRNPLALPCRLRHAGAHRPAQGAKRQQAQRALRQEIDRMRISP